MSPQRSKFQVSFWPERVGAWAPFGEPVRAWTPREALEQRRPQAFGRYRVVMLGKGEPEKLFEAVGTPKGCTISEVDPAARRTTRLSRDPREGAREARDGNWVRRSA